MLKAIGYWITGIGDEKHPAPQELVGAMPADQRARLVDYLGAGMIQARYLGSSWCRFGCGIDMRFMGTRDLTDGVWVWPEGLVHYVRDHQVLLPEDFVAQALSRGTPLMAGWIERDLEWQAQRAGQRAKPAGIEEPEESEDYTFWHQWCESRRLPQRLERLREARRRTETLMAADAVAERAKAIEAALAKHGISQANCLQKNCGQQALTGTYLCVEHYLGEPLADPRQRMGAALHEILGEFSREIGLEADFSYRIPRALPKERESFGTVVMRLFRRN